MLKLKCSGNPSSIWTSHPLNIKIHSSGTSHRAIQISSRPFTQEAQLLKRQRPLHLPYQGVTAASAKLANKNNPTIPLRVVQISRHLSTISSSNNQTPLSTRMASKYTVRKIGAPNTLEHRIYIEKDGVPVSSFHDIPLYANEQQTVLNMVVEIPRWTNGKLEISKEEVWFPHHPVFYWQLI